MWQLKSFSELSPQTLFEIYQARVAVFVVEQNCPYQEVDNKDLNALHLFAKNQQKLTALHPIEAISWLHLAFESIHPFIDGNSWKGI